MTYVGLSDDFGHVGIGIGYYLGNCLILQREISVFPN